MRFLVFVMNYILFIWHPVLAVEEILPRPSGEELAKITEYFRTVRDIPNELRGVWTTKKIHKENDPANSTEVIETFFFCEKRLAQREYTRFRPNGNVDHYQSYGLLTNYVKVSDNGKPVYFILLNTAHWNKRDTINQLYYYPNTRQLKYHSYIHEHLNYSIEYFYSKCPAEKK